ncbi:hypothetical protein [Spirosoma sp. KUDC1026]|uniref:hypothetical protein n=1 Tax=Spirosoma sp. KUDC1026 TaxID=2745947 RepID=UPI00159BA782|nr:hypothetical protein [Spirosoma sp. KUDC1026]QKZ15347.1 hypothetical protein HU175_23080 [Spirosoma sp. KUDC1026]
MKLRQAIGMGLAVGLMACNRAEKSADTPTGAPLYINTAVRPFSDAKLADTMTVSLNGESILTGQVYLQIRNHTGKDIYTATFPASNLVTHAGPVDPSQDEEVVTKQLRAFFRDEHFSSATAVPLTSSTLPDSLKTAWKAVQADSGAVCFSYPAGGTSENRIAYAKRLGKVINVETTAGK